MLRTCRRPLAYAAFFSALLNLLFLAPMIYMLQVYDRVIPSQGKTTLLLLSAILLFALGTLALLEAVRARLFLRASNRLNERFAAPLMRATLLRDGSARPAPHHALRDLDTLRQSLTSPASAALLDLPWLPIYLAIGFLINFWIGVLAAAGSLLIFALAWRSEQLLRRPLMAANLAANRSYQVYEQTVASADLVKAIGAGETMIRGHLHNRVDMLEQQGKASLLSARLTAESRFVRLALQSLALGLGALLAISGQISPGAVFASMFVVGRALAPIDALVGHWRTLVQARGAIITLDEVLGEARPATTRTRLPDPVGKLEVEDLQVTGDEGEEILAGLGFTIEPGEMVAVLGPSGAGKSTLVRALAGAIAVEGGTIRFDDAELRDWDPAQLARHLGFMPQETLLFPGTIKDNISRFERFSGASLATLDEDIVDAAKRAGAHELILRLPGGYDHVVRPGSRSLSAGQMQRVTLARALYRRPRYVLLDEPNANLDNEGDAQLTETLRQLKSEGTTVIIVAHRLSMLNLVDKLLYVQNGRLAYAGGRDDVLQQLNPPRSAADRMVAGRRIAS
ncbi:type I secretion system permease/ATPase [Sphingomonas ginkgonis]|uniref:Type I secretion system permease/ATPase n=1 Tax=Sphingomonas ginkgonis TaxID=2315330 RepID=A0A429VDK6_9SPHN|nr:type I secretion system permease/ATPase [Sphingomonas ginkgonis]